MYVQKTVRKCWRLKVSPKQHLGSLFPNCVYARKNSFSMYSSSFRWKSLALRKPFKTYYIWDVPLLWNNYKKWSQNTILLCINMILLSWYIYNFITYKVKTFKTLSTVTILIKDSNFLTFLRTMVYKEVQNSLKYYHNL